MSASSRGDSLARLLGKQEDELAKIAERIESWTKYKKDYEDLKTLLLNMRDKVKHPYRVPIAGTQLAFVKGNIIHTNEILTLLGDNYFADRSTSQACQIIDRRLEQVNEMLKDSEEAKRNVQQWFEISKDHKREKEEFVEIIERG